MLNTRRDVLAIGLSSLLLAGGPTRAAGTPTRMVFIHGRGQGGQDPAALQQSWLDALARGCATLNKALPAALDVSFPYYGDVLDRFAAAESLPLTSDIQARGTGANDEFLVFQADVAQAMRLKAGVTDDQVAAEYGDNPKPRGPLNWQWVQAIIRAIDLHGGSMSQGAIEEFLRDVFLYTTRAGVRDAVDEIVKAKLTTEPTIVVGHSLGTVVAYNVLRSDPRPLQVPLLVTVGSPLGIRAVRDQLVPLRYPKAVQSWYNAYDTRDVVALYPLDGSNFPVRPDITNNGTVKNHTDNRHGIDGYLDDTNVATQLLDVLGI